MNDVERTTEASRIGSGLGDTARRVAETIGPALVKCGAGIGEYAKEYNRRVATRMIELERRLREGPILPAGDALDAIIDATSVDETGLGVYEPRRSQR
jgi:hypothetical protein